MVLQFNLKVPLSFFCLIFLITQAYTQSDTILPVQIHGDSIINYNNAGLGFSVGEGTGTIGVRAYYSVHPRWVFIAGVGYWHFSATTPAFSNIIFNSTTTTTQWGESSLLFASRYYVKKGFFFMSGISVKLKNEKLTSGNKVTSVKLGAVGIPLALGFETGWRKGERMGLNLEIGLAMYAGPASKNHELIIVKNNVGTSEKFEGISGSWVGFGLAYYFVL